MKKILFLVILFMCMQVCFAESSQISGQAYDLYVKSHVELQKQNYSGAINYIKQALELAPNNYDLTYKLGIYYISKPAKKLSSPLVAYDALEKDPDLVNAINAFKKAIDIDPNRWEAYIATARIYDGLDITPIAVMWYNKGLAQPNITQEAKSYYTKARDEAIKRQADREGKLNNLNKTADLYIPLDMNKWYKATYKGDDAYWFSEYGLKGEDVINYKWTKLVSIHFYNKNNYDFNSEYIRNFMIDGANKTAVKLNDKIKSSDIFRDDENLYFEWSIPKLNESEIARVYNTPKGIYCIRYTSKQPTFSQAEKSNIIELLKKFTVK